MNILIDVLPDLVEIDGQEYPINTDYRTCLRVIMAFEDEDLTGTEKQLVMLQNLYPIMPENIEGAIEQARLFLNCGKPEEEDSSGPGYRLYSFAKDADMIFAAYRQTHNIDLISADLHWWEFLALFMDLGAETTFCNLIALRKRVKSGKASKEEIQAARDMGEMFNIPEIRTPEEKAREEEFMRQVREGERNRENQNRS